MNLLSRSLRAEATRFVQACPNIRNMFAHICVLSQFKCVLVIPIRILNVRICRNLVARPDNADSWYETRPDTSVSAFTNSRSAIDSSVTWDGNDPKPRLASPNPTANLSGLALGCIEADFCKTCSLCSPCQSWKKKRAREPRLGIVSGSERNPWRR